MTVNSKFAVRRLTVFLAFWIAATPVAQDRDRPEVTVPALERRVFELINTERLRLGLKPLKLDARLSDIARAHSRDMGRRDFFDHINPDGKNLTDRARAAKYRCTKYEGDTIRMGLAENIFQNNLYDRIFIRGERTNYEWNSAEKIAVSTMNGWMESPGHRRNILDGAYDRTGVGIDIATNDKVFITQLFC